MDIEKSWQEFLKKTNLKEEYAEISDGFYEKTGYPEPVKSYRLIIEKSDDIIEETYFWFLNFLRQDLGYPFIDKIIDTFSASESSSLWGQTTQRLNLQQERAGGYLRVISELIKQLFQILRELRMIDEKLELRDAWDKKKKSADVTLKSEFVELVENGVQNINSVYGLAQKVGFTILPDLFFNTFVTTKEEAEEVVKKMEFNPKVKNVLIKKLINFLIWKKQTDKEFKARRSFQLKYLYQHWQTIRAYSKWIKPYLLNIKRLSMNQKHLEKPDIVSAFETSLVELEILARKPTGNGGNSCILVNFLYTTSPEMNYHTRDYASKGPIHRGKVIVTIRAYAWTDEQIKEYKKYRDLEDIELLGLADDKLESAIDMLGDTFKKYIAELEPEENKDKKSEDKNQNTKKPKQDSLLSMFLGPLLFFKEFLPETKAKPKSKPAPNLKGASKGAAATAWVAFKIYKKAHGMFTW